MADHRCEAPLTKWRSSANQRLSVRAAGRPNEPVGRPAAGRGPGGYAGPAGRSRRHANGGAAASTARMERASGGHERVESAQTSRGNGAEQRGDGEGSARGAGLTVTEGCPPGCVRAPAAAQHFVRSCCSSCWYCCSCCGSGGGGGCCCCGRGRARSRRPRFCASTHTLQGHAGSGPKIFCGRDGSLPVRMRRVLGRHNRDPLFTSHSGRWESLAVQTFDERRDGRDALIHAAFLPHWRDVTARRQSTGRVRCQSRRVSKSRQIPEA